MREMQRHERVAPFRRWRFVPHAGARQPHAGGRGADFVDEEHLRETATAKAVRALEARGAFDA
jgi:hypothetical protein